MVGGYRSTIMSDIAAGAPDGSRVILTGSARVPWGSSIKSIHRIAWRIRAERGHSSGTIRQQQRDQIRRALEQPVEPVIRLDG
jgi:hypothetical protein